MERLGRWASVGPHRRLEVRAALARELGVRDPLITWHVARDTIAEILNFLSLIGGSLGKVAYDIMIMSSNELGEVSEPFVPYRGASRQCHRNATPFPVKSFWQHQNYFVLMQVWVSTQWWPTLNVASGPWHLEWVAIPEAFVVCVGALHQASFALSGIVVNVDVMHTNLHSTTGLISGEAVMMELAPFVGRQKAHDIVYEACKTATQDQRTLFELLKANSEVMNILDEQRVAFCCDPLNYLGASQTMVDNIVAQAKRNLS